MKVLSTEHGIEQAVTTALSHMPGSVGMPAPISHTSQNPESSSILTLPHSHPNNPSPKTLNLDCQRPSITLPDPCCHLQGPPAPGPPAGLLIPTLASLQLVPDMAAGVIFSRCKSNHVISPIPASIKAFKDFPWLSGWRQPLSHGA